jgi:hypothetical protein
MRRVRVWAHSSAAFILLPSAVLAFDAIGNLSTLDESFREPESGIVSFLADSRTTWTSLVLLVIAVGVLVGLVASFVRPILLWVLPMMILSGFLLGLTLRLYTAEVVGANIGAGWATLFAVPLSLALIALSIFAVVPTAMRPKSS